MHLTVRDLMETDICRLSQEATLLQASRQLLAQKVSQLCVVNEQNQFLGVLPDYAILKARMAGDSWDEPVSRYVSRCVSSVLASEELPKVMALFREGRYETVPVLEQNCLVGELHRATVLEMMLALDPTVSDFVQEELDNELILESQCELDMMSMKSQDEQQSLQVEYPSDPTIVEHQIPRPHITRKAKGMISNLGTNSDQPPAHS